MKFGIYKNGVFNEQLFPFDMIPRVIRRSEFVFSGSGYLAQCEGVIPPKNIYAHISGIDLVQAKNGSWYVL